LSVGLSFLFHFVSGGYQFLHPNRAIGRLGHLTQMLIGFMAVQYVAPAIMMSWIVLLVSGGWESEHSWIDRLGRGIGLLWIGMYAESLIETYWWAIS
jgi:hypothetical protein